MQLKNVCAILASCAALVGGAAAEDAPFRHMKEMVHERAARRASIGKKAYEAKVQERADTSTFRYYNQNTSKFFVKSLPDVHFDLGEFYSGAIDIQQNDNSRNLFFAFMPTIGKPVDEVTIWLNGGPGCSSLEGFFQENGRFLWVPGTYLPVENPYSWVNLTNMLYVEQPVGTGYSKGPKTATSQEEIAADFVKWFKNFQTTFGIKNYKIYVTGESYAGRYVPYISAAMLDQKDPEYYNLSGALIYDPSIGSGYAQEQSTAVPFVNVNQNLFKFNDTFMSQINGLHESCGYAAYLEKYLVFPPAGIQPTKQVKYNSPCDVFDSINNAALEINNCFDIYEVNQQCPLLWDVLSFPTQLVYTPEGATTYFNRSDVKTAMHAPQNVDWEICTNGILNQDTSAPSIAHVIPQVIEATNRMLISSADLDMILITNGTLMSIQNMTWGGKLGFQSRPSTPINIALADLAWTAEFNDPANFEQGIDGPQGVMGVQHYERGLMWGQTFLAGHMQPEFQPRVALRHIEWVLGRVNQL